jgi:SAM-dependent methyltransferase
MTGLGGRVVKCTNVMRSGLAFPAAAFDAICSYYAIIHVPREEHQRLLLNFYHMLKPNGFALLYMGVGDLPEDTEEDWFGTPMYWSHYDGETNVKMLKECGFKIIFAKSVADSLSESVHLFLLAQKPGG